MAGCMVCMHGPIHCYRISGDHDPCRSLPHIAFSTRENGRPHYATDIWRQKTYRKAVADVSYNSVEVDNSKTFEKNGDVQFKQNPSARNSHVAECP